MENNTKTDTEKNGEATQLPKFNIPTQMDYTAGFNFEPLNGTQILREVITDTYVTASENEDNMVQKIDDAMSILYPKRRGFAGYLSFCYLHLTLFYILGDYENCFKVIDNIFHGLDSIEKYIFTGKYESVENDGIGFLNYAFGESDAELENTVKFLHDTYNVAKMVHSKASSFESGYSLSVAELMLHSYNKQLGLMRKDCENIRSIVERVKKFLEDEKNHPNDGESVESSVQTEFASIEDIKQGN